MLFSLTAAGEALIAATPGVPPILDSFELGNGFGYTPSTADTGLHGTAVHVGAPSPGVIQSNSLVKYAILLDANLGTFAFGEVALKSGGVTVALGASSFPASKTRLTGTNKGNSIVIDAYLTTVGTSYSVYAELGNSDLEYSVAEPPTVDNLPGATGASPNIFPN